MSREEDPPLYRLRWRCGRPPDPRELRKESRQWYARRERASRRAVCLLNFERRGFASAPLTAAPPSRRYNSFSGRDGVQSARARAPQAHRAAVSARFPPATARYLQAEGTKPSTSSVAKRARDDVVANDARTTPALEKQNPRPTLRYVVPSRGDVPPEAEKENGGEPDKASAKRPAAKRQKKVKKKPGAPRDDPKQVTLSRAFAGAGATSPETTTRASEGVATPESIDDIELAPVTENAETRRKKPRDGDDDDGDGDDDDDDSRRVSSDPFVLFGGDANVSPTAFAETFARAMRTASAFSIGVLFRDVVGRRRFGFRSNASPEPDAPRKEAARKAARAAGGGAPPPEGGWQAAVRRVPSAVGVLPLGADVHDAGDGVGGVLFAFPVVSRKSSGSREVPGDEPHPHRGDPRAYATTLKKYSLRPEHAAALASALRAGKLPAVAFHAQAVFKALSALGVCCEPLLARLTVLDARAMAWLRAPDAPHEGGVEEVWRSCFPADTRVAARDGGAGGNESRHAYESAFGAFRRDLASAAALTQRFRRATQGDVLPCANPDPDPRARFARTTRRECRVAALLGAMEHTGIGFDVAYARRVVTRFRDEIQRVERAADALAVVNADGSRVNLAAPAQVATALFQTLRLPAPPVLKERGERGGAQLSTRDEVLRALASGPNAHPLVGLVVRHRAATRAAATCASYVSTYEKQNGSSTEGSIGRLRCEWNNTRTATGRLSSSNPNLQAVGGVSISESLSEKDADVPVGADDGNACVSLRGAFVAPEGRVLLAADYSQIELRVLARLARDSRLLEIFAHSSADAFERIWNAGRGFPASAPVTRADRAKAKTTVYGLLYGQGEAGLAHKLGVSREEARDLTRALYAAFPSLRRFIRETREDARRRRGAFLPLAARLRPLPGLGSADASVRAEAERRAVNTLVQGTAADLVKLAMERWCRAIATTASSASPRSDTHALPVDIEIPAGFDPARASLVAQIHDELMFEVDGDARCVEATAQCARACMEGAAEELGLTGLWTPTKVTVGKTWETLVPIEAFLANARAKNAKTFSDD